MSTITDKLWGIYRESRDAGLDVSLTVSICNGAETFVFKSVPSNCVADMGNHGRRKHGRGRGRGRRGGRAQRAARSAGAAQLAAAPPSHETSAGTLGLAPAAPSYAAVARSPPSLLQSRTVKRAKRPSGALARAAADAVTPVAAVSSAESPVDYIGTAPRAAASSVASVVVAMPAAVESASAADAGEAVTAADVASPPATAAAGRAVAAAAVEHPRPLPPFTMELRRRAVSFSSPSPSPIIFSTPSPSTTPLSPLQQLDGLTSPDLNPYPNPSASSPAITPPDPTPNPTSPFSSKLTYSYSFSPLHTRSCTLCGEEELRAREYPEYRSDRKCSNCFKEVKANRNNFHKQQFLSGKFKASTVYFSDFSVFLCSDCYNDKEFCLGEYLDDELFE